MKKGLNIWVAIFLFALLMGCGDGGGSQYFGIPTVPCSPNSPTVPIVLTGNYEDASPSTGIGHGNVTSDGCAPPVFERGICWGTSPNPSKETGDCVSTSAGTGPFSEVITGVVYGVVYYMCAFASNPMGTGWGRSYQITLPH